MAREHLGLNTDGPGRACELYMNDFLPIPEFEGLYLCSPKGQVWSEKSKKMLKPYLTHRGYMRLSLFKDGKYTKKHVHQLVMITFVGPQGNLEVNHKNGNKTDNRLINLEYVTSRQNKSHAIENELYRIHGSDNAMSKLTEEEVEFILFKEAGSYASIARKYGVSDTKISQIKNCKNWRHVSEGREHLIIKTPNGDGRFKCGD